MAFNTIDLNNGFESIAVEGFKFKKEVMGYSWERENSDKMDRIVIGYGGYSDSFKIYTPIVGIFFKKVEEVLKPAYELSKVKGLYNHTTIHKSLINIEGIDYKIFDNEINSNKMFERVATEIEKLILKGALPFFEKYQSLKAVFEETEKMDIEKMSNFIGQPLPFRRMIIKKLCNDPSYENYYKLILDFYKAEGAENEVKLTEHLYNLLQDKL